MVNFYLPTRSDATHVHYAIGKGADEEERIAHFGWWGYVSSMKWEKPGHVPLSVPCTLGVK